MRSKTSLDDSLDVVAAHGLGGDGGALLTGVFAEKALNGAFDGALFGNPGQVALQGAAVLGAMFYSAAGTFVVLKLIGLVMPLRATASEEAEGLDITAHGEEAYAAVGGSLPGRRVPRVRRIPSSSRLGPTCSSQRNLLAVVRAGARHHLSSNAGRLLGLNGGNRCS